MPRIIWSDATFVNKKSKDEEGANAQMYEFLLYLYMYHPFNLIKNIDWLDVC